MEEIRGVASKKTLLIFLGILAIGAVGLVLIAEYKGILKAPIETPAFENESVPESAPEESAIWESEEVNNIIGEAIRAQDLFICERIENEKARKQCKRTAVTTEAVVKLDVDVCNKLKDESSRLACNDNVIIVKAGSEKNLGLCNQLTDKTRIEECKQGAGLL